jgi:branched-chain amino acid transport system substrate-binding protein
MWWWLLSGCLLGPKPTPCTSNPECRDAFGFGYVCADDYCAPAEVPARCETTWPEDLLTAPEKYRDALVVGTIYSREFDEVQRKSTELAFRQYAADETNDGMLVALMHCDTDEDVAYDDLDVVAAAAEVTRIMTADLGIPAIVGPSTSGESLEVIAPAARGGAVVVSPSATSPELAAAEPLPTEAEPGTFWRTVPPDDLQTFAIAEDMRLRGVSELYVIYEDNAYGRPLGTGVADLFSGGNAQVVSYTNLANLSVSAIPDTAEVLFVSSQSADVASFLDSLGSVGDFTGTVFLADAAADPSLFTVSPQARSLFPRIRGTRPQVLTDGYDPYTDFVGAYSGVFAQDGAGADSNAYASYSYDAGWMVLVGAAWAQANEGEITGQGISRAFLHVLQGPAVQLNAAGYQTAVASFAAGDDIDVFGASGPLDWVDGEVDNNIEVWVIDDGNDDFVVDLVCSTDAGCRAP